MLQVIRRSTRGFGGTCLGVSVSTNKNVGKRSIMSGSSACGVTLFLPMLVTDKSFDMDQVEVGGVGTLITLGMPFAVSVDNMSLEFL